VTDSLVEIFERFGESAYRVKAPAPVRRQGTVGHSRDHFELYFAVGQRKDWVRIDVRLEEQRREVLIANLVSSDAIATHAPLRFPLNLAVTRERIGIRVDDVELIFTAFLCRRLAVAVGQVDGRWLYVHSPKQILRRLVVAREDPRNLRRFLSRMDQSLEAHRAIARRHAAKGR
jgi:hypothetical protein